MATYDHTPHGRGYDFSLGYFHHDNDYWNEQAGSCDQKKVMITDLWHAFTNESGDAHEHGAFGLNGSSYIHNTTEHVPAVNGTVADYEDYKLAETTVRLIRNWRKGDAPLFINHDFHIVHEPLQVPFEYYSKFLFMEDDYLEHRRIYASMVHFMDAAVGNITAELKANNMWDNSIVIGWRFVFAACFFHVITVAHAPRRKPLPWLVPLSCCSTPMSVTTEGRHSRAAATQPTTGRIKAPRAIIGRAVSV